MVIKMKYLNQKIIKFNYDQNFEYENFYISKSNKHIFSLLDKWLNGQKTF